MVRGVLLYKKASPRGCARRRVSERNRRRRLLAWRLKLSPKVTDEGRTLCGNLFAGNRGKLSPHPALRGHLLPQGRRLQGFFFGICTSGMATFS